MDVGDGDEWKKKTKKDKKSKKGEDGDAPRKKRVRIAKACDLCVVKKLKCDGSEPCFRCKTTSQSCTYLRQHKVPVRRKKHYYDDGDLPLGFTPRPQPIVPNGRSNAAMDPYPDQLGLNVQRQGKPPGSGQPKKQKRPSAAGSRRPWEEESDEEESSSDDESAEEYSEDEDSGEDNDESTTEVNGGAPLKRKRTNSAPLPPLMSAGINGALNGSDALQLAPRSRHSSIVYGNHQAPPAMGMGMPRPKPSGTVSISEILPEQGDEFPGANGFMSLVSRPGPRRWSSLSTTQLNAIQMSVPDDIPLFADLPPLPTQEIQNLLVGLYFEKVWPWLPCIDKTRFLRDFASYPPILTYSIYACAARYCEDPSIDSRQHPTSTPNLMLIRCARLLPTVFDVRRPTVHHVQAILNMCVQSNTRPEFEQGRMWVGMAMVVARIVGLCTEGGVDGAGGTAAESWNRGISTITEGEDKERKMDEMRRTWYCCLAYDRFAGMSEPRTWSAALDEGRDVRIPPPWSIHDGPPSQIELTGGQPKSDALMSLYSLYARVVEFRQHCSRKGVDPCDLATQSGKRMYSKLRYLDGIVVGWYRSLPDSVRSLNIKDGEQGRKTFLESAYMLMIFYAMRVILNGPTTVLSTEELVASSPATLHAWMSTPCFLISTTSAGNISRVLESVLDLEGERGMDFASPLLWVCIWKSAIIRAVSVRAVRVYSGVSVNGRTTSGPAAAPGIDPAAVVARETRELAAFRRAVYAIRKWWIPASEARSKRSLFEHVFHEIGFPIGWKPDPSEVVEDEGEERVAKMAAVVIVREEVPSHAGSAEPNNVSSHGSPEGMEGVLRPYPVHPLGWPDHMISGNTNGSVQGESTDMSDMDDLDVQRHAQDAHHYELATTPAGVGAPTPPPMGLTEWDLQFSVGGDTNPGGHPGDDSHDILSGGQSTWRPGVSGGLYGYLGSASSPGGFWGNVAPSPAGETIN
ncbi:hypothetical protein M427DRAFT_61001 [Gonapodya prolifera JEL478]|uniref:Zn(2)-C6 fungal-type domain-containing protein n=1 Tax=Gonapodya prolifera (strain JEL478) TaxID=1344416 RepID=A0A139A372_GONPJ|nr:hypothetical protein M427DRAFT_61001 [Gonapodya prolifera JEL478]|eukprot:KXS11211.1 hypothetical protein M427DRAFT_61001 [Gonapodya prolifera JEL478]